MKLCKFKELKAKPSKENELIESYLNQIELRFEEKFSNIGHAFRFLDANGDSKVSFDEFWVGLDKIGIIMEKSTCKELFDYIDKNKDNNIEFNEFWDSFQTFYASKAEINKLSRTETQNLILESIRKEQGGTLLGLILKESNLFAQSNFHQLIYLELRTQVSATH